LTEHSQARVTQARANLEHAVAALRDSAAWRRNLAILARFPRYSINNQFLIAYQKPEATYVRGFKSWLDVGRAVRKGERGIAIFAPRPWERTLTDDKGAESIEAGISFAVVHVFDVSQTDPIPGHPNPWQPPCRHSASGDEGLSAALWSALFDHAVALGLTVSTHEADCPGADVFGYYHPGNCRVWVRPARALADMTATFAHELAHAITHEATQAMSHDVREVVAESIAYAVCSRFGLDLELRSSHYVASWLDDPETFRVCMSAIHDGAAALIDAIEAELSAVDALPFAA
jgi:antirestriction protein ArdC